MCNTHVNDFYTLIQIIQLKYYDLIKAYPQEIPNGVEYVYMYERKRAVCKRSGLYLHDPAVLCSLGGGCLLALQQTQSWVNT